MKEVRLIDANALKDIEYINKGNFNTVEGIREWIDNAPTVEFSKEICSVCGRYIREKGGAE